MVCVLDFKREVGLWHAVLTVSCSPFHWPLLLLFDGWIVCQRKITCDSTMLSDFKLTHLQLFFHVNQKINIQELQFHIAIVG